ncbi:hypothetical protein POTOM_043954 [Populus tomentosa]|uniref:NADP-dependent oxidoreductase domain-containing protein n=1 Tax=Populus tomentosa TaxID=118781 RepID=A0A8X8CFW5_POPTO|nr:hypothetical protein POTOM_043954 [Populus tomentosa]
MRQYLPFVVNCQQLLAIYLATALLHKELARALDTLTPLLSPPLLPHFHSNNAKGEELKTMAEEQKVIIPRVKLGNQGLEVSKLGFGCMGLSGMYNAPLPEEVGISFIKEAYSKGITFFDTADVYGPQTNEILVGKALKHLPREKIQLATKFGVFPNRTEIKNPAINGSPEYIRACCDTSLKRLDLECIDLYYQHRVDTSVPIEETVC